MNGVGGNIGVPVSTAALAKRSAMIQPIAGLAPAQAGSDSAAFSQQALAMLSAGQASGSAAAAAA